MPVLLSLGLAAPAAAQSGGRQARPVTVSTETLYEHLVHAYLPPLSSVPVSVIGAIKLDVRER